MYSSSSLHTQKQETLTLYNRLHAIPYSLSLLLLFHRHLSSSSSSLLLVADLVLAFMWVLAQPYRFRPIRRQEHPDRLLKLIGQNDLPALDIFVCTADPWKEPPMTVVNTVLSVMAYEYPSEKLSVFVSDDGGSDLTFFALMEAARFARYWLPFCRENGVAERAPEAYFECNKDSTGENMKMMYNKIKEKVERAMEKGYVSCELVMNADKFEVFKKWEGFTRRDHPAVVELLVDNSKDSDIMGNAIPNLIYVSREKNSASPHHFKAGALNALLRVSNTMTNAPIILTLDCDMYSNDPQTPLRTLCYILDPALAPKLSFVQFPQRFQGLNKNDIYGGEIKRLFTINSRGLDGLKGPNYVGTGCFFRRCSFFGSPSCYTGEFGSDLKEDAKVDGSICSEPVLKRAHEAAGCNFESGTKWGDMIGFRYGSLVEDYFTGYRLHCEGWVSVFCNPNRPAFLGDAPKSLEDVLGQCKRWMVGLYEVGISKYSPLFYGARKASLLVGLGYALYAFWAIWCIPITIYALLPQLALIYDVPLFPKLSDPWFYLYAYLFLAAYFQDLLEFIAADGTFTQWWSDQRMWMIKGSTAFTFGTVQYIINQMGLSAPGFTLTNKTNENEQIERYDKGKFSFGIESPFFVPLGTTAIINLCALVFGTIKAVKQDGGFDERFVHLFISAFGVVNCWPILEAMFLRKDGGKMPRKVTCISILLAGVICFLAYLTLAY